MIGLRRMDAENEVTERVRSAREAGADWSRLDVDERFGILKAAAKRLLRERDDIVSIVQKELGKVRADALFTEGLGPLDAVTGWMRVVEQSVSGKVSLNRVAFPQKSARVELIPRGVVGIIAPWNFPVAGLYRSVFPALLLGNSVVVKASEHSPRSSGWFLNILAEELPAGVVQMLSGDGRVGQMLLQEDIDACVFTGSSRVGREVEETCRARGIACSAEMGGNDAAVVFDDADLPRTVAGLTHWALQNAGQACGALEVVYVDSRVEAELVERLTDAFRRLNTEGYRDRTLAPLALNSQFELVKSQIEDAVTRGATVETGGKSEGLWLEPTLLSGCNESMQVVSEETFGPVLPVVAVDGPSDAIRRVNRGKYGLTCSLWTQDLERARNLARSIDVGTVTVNNHAFTGAIPDLPWSGRRSSGRGIANSAWSLLTFARPQTVVVDYGSGPEPFWAPFDDKLERLGNLLADAQLGRITQAYQIPLLLQARRKVVKAFFGM